jgi:hypothetical protein
MTSLIEVEVMTLQEQIIIPHLLYIYIIAEKFMEVKMFPTFGLDQVAAKIIGVGLLDIMLIAGYYYWKHTVKTEALLEWNKAQQEQEAKEQQKLNQDLTEINKTQQNILGELRNQNMALEKKFNDLDGYLNKDSTVKQYKGKGSSDVLRRTFKELNK